MNNSVLTGIDALARDGFASLQGRRVGLVTNHTGLTQDGLPTIDALHQAKGVELVALFGPEHGLRGEFDAEVADDVDARTGLPVYSLYGARQAPTEEQMADLDTLVFDIQDIGCRFYTYLSTLGHVLEAASKYQKRVVVLDRPNPITSMAVEGPLADADKLSFTACHPLPIRHGMTLGEIAWLLHTEKNLTCDLEIIPCRNWRRGDWFDQTGLLWTNPSPNMRGLTAAALYPGVGLLEMTNVSVGRGTDAPFEVVGAPFVQPRVFAAALNDADLPGIRFLPIEFKPRASVQASQQCSGVRLLVTDRDALNAVQIGLTLAVTLRRLYPDEWAGEKFSTLLANGKVFAAVMAGQDYAGIAAGWQDELQAFAARRENYLLYS